MASSIKQILGWKLLSIAFFLSGLLASLAYAATKLSKTADAPEFPVVNTWQELIEEYLDFREHNYPLVVPVWFMGDVQTEAILKESDFEALQEEPNWYWNFNGDVYVFDDDSPLAKQVKHDTQIMIYEDMVKQELVVLSAPEKEGGEYREEIVYRAPEWAEVQKGEDSERYLWRELSQRQIVWQVTLKSKSLAEKEAAELAAAQAANPIKDSGEGGGMRLMMGREDYTNDLWLSIRGPEAGLTNLEIAAHIPTGFTNRIEIFTATNLLDSWWTLAATNVLTEGTDTVYWTYETTEGEVGPVYVAIGNAEIDSDGDGLTDAREKFLYRTDPSAWDTDADGMPDSWELQYDLDPFDASDAAFDPDDDGLTNLQEYQLGADLNNPDTDGDSLPDGWEVQYGLDPLDDGSLNAAHGATGDPDGDGFTNLEEYQQGAPPNNPAWNGQQLVDRLLNAHSTGVRGKSLRKSLRVEVEDSANCGGHNANRQIQEDVFSVPDMLDCGYFIDVTVEGLVEDQNDYYDQVHVETFTNVYYFEGNENHNGCSMANKVVTRNHLVLANSQIILRYDTMSYMYHVGGFAEIVDAYLTDVLKVESITPDASCNPQEIDDQDGNPKTRIFLVPVTNAGEVTVTADISPDLDESALPACMTLQGGNGSAKLTRTVSRTTPSKTVFTFDSCGSDSGLRTTLYVYDAALWLFADEGTAVWQWPWNFNVGHAWWGADIDSFSYELIPQDVHNYADELGGFWPQQYGDPLGPGEVRLDTAAGGGHGVTGSKRFQISFDHFINALAFFKEMYELPSTYDFFNHNCTDVAVQQGEHGEVYTISTYGVTSPEDLSDWLNSN